MMHGDTEPRNRPFQDVDPERLSVGLILTLVCVERCKGELYFIRENDRVGWEMTIPAAEEDELNESRYASARLNEIPVMCVLHV